jgi:pimeloyl-ACP methyl ester carboxylesterase
VANPDALAGLVLVDAALHPPRTYLERAATRRPPTERRYPTRADAMVRFRLMPPQRHPDDEVMATLAAYSVRETADGWTWKHDHRGFPALYDPEVALAAARAPVPLGYVYGGDSGLVDDEAAAFVRSTVPTDVTTVRIPGASHHLPLDAPHECVAAIAELIASWTGRTDG